MTDRLQILIGDVRARLRDLEADSVQLVVTSPPYWGLRDYGTAPQEWPAGEFAPMPAAPAVAYPAWRGELGQEPDPMMFIGHMVEVFREVRRVLKPDGVCWVNMGDCFATGAGAVGNCPGGGAQGAKWRGDRRPETNGRGEEQVTQKGRGTREGAEGKHGYNPGIGLMTQPNRLPIPGLKPKDLVGQPWRVAFALQADGWWLRNDVIWHKPNPMPESVTDRCTRAHEYLFHLAKSEKYFFDAEAIKEPVTGGANHRGQGVNPKASGKNSRINKDRDPAHQTEAKIRAKQNRSFSAAVTGLVERRNKRSVWAVATEPYADAHYATFPTGLVRPCVLSSSRRDDVVLDPFGGSGTTAEVALEYGRRALLIDLNPNNERLMLDRTRENAAQETLPI